MTKRISALLGTFVLATALALAAIRCGQDVALGTDPGLDGGTDAADAER